MLSKKISSCQFLSKFRNINYFVSSYFLVSFCCLIVGCTLSENSVDEKDTYFTWESQQASKSWGKQPPKLETMFGFRLRMSKLEYETTFDSLILVGMANEKRQIRFGNTFDEYFDVEPHFHNDTIFQIDFEIQPTLTNLDTIIRTVDMRAVIEKLYTDMNIKKTDTTYSSDNKEVIYYEDAYGWLENNRLIKVYRRVFPNSTLLSYDFDDVEFTDLEFEKRYKASLLNQEISNLDTIRTNKLNNINK